MDAKIPADDLRRALEAVSSLLPDVAPKRLETELGKRKARDLIRDIMATSTGLKRLADQLDPVRPPPFSLDPNDPKVTGMLMAMYLRTVAPTKLGAIGEFYGSGVYAVYYFRDVSSLPGHTRHPVPDPRGQG